MEIVPHGDPKVAGGSPSDRWSVLRSTVPVSERGFFHVQEVAKAPIFSRVLVVHNGVVEDYFGLEAWARRHGAAVDGSARVAIPALEDGTYTLCRGGVGEYAALAAGIVLAERCRSVFLPPGGEVVVSPP